MADSHDRGQGAGHVSGAGITRRRLVQYGVGAGAGLLMWRFVGGRAWAQPTATSVLDPTSIPKYVTPLVIPPAMPRSGRPPGGKGRGVDYYRIAVRQFRQPILPASMGLGPTTVWSYGSLDHPDSFNYPAFTIEARWRQPVRVKWINDLVKPSGEFRPHLLPVDQTLHWANPPGGVRGRDSHGDDHAPYRGPVPIVTHLHGGHSSQEFDGTRRPGTYPMRATSRRGTRGEDRATAISRRRPSGHSARRGRPAARSFSTTTTTGRRRCGTTTTRSA